MKVWILGAVSLWTICSFAQQQEVPIYLDNNQPIEKRVEDALARMTLEEKVAMTQIGRASCRERVSFGV